MRMAGAEYSTASYISHIIKGLPRGYNLMKRMMMVPGTRESLDEDSITSYIFQDEAMQEAKQPTELFPQVNYAALTKMNQQQGQRRKPSGGGRSTEDVDEKRSTWDKGRASCLMVGVTESTVSLAPEVGEDFQAVAVAVQANAMAVLLDTGCSHHLMGTKAVFVDMAPSDGVKHVRGFNRALQPVEGREIVALQGEARKRVLIPGVLYVPGIQANVLSAGQLKENGVQQQGDGDDMLLVAATREVLGRARYNGQVLCTDLCPCSMRSSPTEVVALRTIVSATKSTLDRLHARLAHFSVDTIKSSAKHEVAIGLDITPSTGADPPSGGEQLVEGSKQLVDDLAVDEEGELSAGEESTDSDVVEVPITKPKLQRTGRARRLPELLSFHACLLPAAFTAVYDEVDDDLLYDDAEEDEELPELDPDMHADPEHRWDIATMTLVERPRRVNIMKNRWVLTTKYRLDDTVEREKARLVVKGFKDVCGADYNETYSPVSNYVTLRIFLSIVAIFDLNLMQLDMKNAFLQSKLDRVLYMYQPDYFDDGIGRVCKLLKSLYGLKQSPLLWYRALDGVLLDTGWKKSQVDEALYFKAGDNGVTCWVLVYVDDLLAASSSPVMLKELKELLEDAFELREILPVVKYLGLEIVRDTSARKLWHYQQGYVDKLRRRFIDKEQGGRVPKTPVSVDAYAELTFDDEEAQECEEEEYRQKVGSLQFAATSTRPDIVFACNKLGSGLMSEYVAATNAGKEGRRLCFLLAEFKLLDAGKPTILRVDNKSAITVAAGLGLTGNLKHMERRYAWLQHMVRRGKFVLKYVPTTEQPTDFLTKALHFLAFNRCSVAIGQVRLTDVGDGDNDVQQ
ncbi:unnamed protein product [Closterium sp. NIES-54]